MKCRSCKLPWGGAEIQFSQYGSYSSVTSRIVAVGISA